MSESSKRRWTVHLRGDEGDLRDLANGLGESRVRVCRAAGGGYVLEGERFEELESARLVREEAERLCELLSGGAALALGARRPISPTAIAETKPEGGVTVHVEAAGGLVARGSVGAVIIGNPDGSDQVFRATDPIPGWLEHGSRSPRAARVLRIVGRGPLDWRTLYNVVEILEEAVGGPEALATLGGINGKALERLKHTSGSPGVVGDDARHGVDRSVPPAKPLGLADARALVQQLVRSWLDAGAPDSIAT